jgi:ABC-type nitrate/sulfonate/bicarbonate transport system substrate-binding protein
VKRRSFLGALGLQAGAALFAPTARAARDVTCLMPDGDNLQYLAYWVAQGAGLFTQADVAVSQVFPPHPRLAIERFSNDAAPLAVLPPPVYHQLIGSGVPIRLVASLLRRDAINVVVAGPLRASLPPASAPVAERVAALAGKTIGIAPHPQNRFHALVEGAGFPRDHMKIITVPGPEQNQAFASGGYDALFAHTPFLERAITQQGAELYISPSSGEVPALDDLSIHALCAQPSYVEREPDAVQAVVDAIALAQRLARGHVEAARTAIAAAFPALDARALDVVVPLYARALPADPRLSLAAARRTRELFPAIDRTPVSDDALAAALDDRFAARAARRAERRLARLVAPGAILAGGIAGWLLARRRRPAVTRM